MVKYKREEEEKQREGGGRDKEKKRSKKGKDDGGFLFLLDTDFQILTLVLISLPGIRKLSSSWSSV